MDFIYGLNIEQFRLMSLEVIFSKSIEELILGIKSKIGVSYIVLVFVFIVKKDCPIESN